MAAEPASLPPAYADPEAYLRREQFHRRTTFTPSYAAASSPSSSSSQPTHTVSYAVAGSLDPAAPTIVWLNGMGGHRIAATSLDGLLLSRGVRLITLDRPSGGLSTPVPLAHRVPASLDALLAVLSAERTTTFSLLSHSNGLLYALHTLSHLPLRNPDLRVLSWHLSSPYVPPWLSGSRALAAARWVPAPLVAQLGTLAGAAQRLAGPVARGVGWGSAAMRDWRASAWVSLGTTAASTGSAAARPAAGPAAAAREGEAGEEEGEEVPERLPPPKQLARFRRLNALRPPHRRLFGGESIPPGLFSRATSLAVNEGLDAMGHEAMLCLRQGGARWATEGEDEGDEAGLYERAFGGLRRTLQQDEGRGRGLEISVWYGEDDALVPRQGREYLRELLVERLGLVDPAKGWHEVEDAGHDDTLGLCCVVEPLLDDVVRVHRAQ
ncbi:hypothetical protein DMC30DRAFT_389877 [Rhodotorula diobovata]|uniref:AB hydrolase-1 domain-containing protein n=1 Tax=Rhodotorula diobovata TaxID=5288 RepID=A0A5C5G612_9BASI|nr:hypothetical protein DMC30DRAFT_389877 [Rhodotorula diobovata]